MEIIGIIFLVIILFILGGICGWVLKAIGYVIEFLFNGCLNSLGCLFWGGMILLLLLGLMM